jgi:hypothetical protein
MEETKVAALIQALELVGQVYRNKDGSKPADALLKIVQQLKGMEGMTLVEWVREKQSGSKRPGKKTARSTIDDQKIAENQAKFERAVTQPSLIAAINTATLSAAEWQRLAQRLTGKRGTSGKAAREIVEEHYSAQLLLQERVSDVQRAFGRLTPPPAAS